jgi:hypothetical protein
MKLCCTILCNVSRLVSVIFLTMGSLLCASQSRMDWLKSELDFCTKKAAQERRGIHTNVYKPLCQDSKKLAELRSKLDMLEQASTAFEIDGSGS